MRAGLGEVARSFAPKGLDVLQFRGEPYVIGIHGLHNLDFPFLYYKRPLWDIVLIVFSAGGLALSVTTLLPSWRRLVRHVRHWPPALARLAGRTGDRPAHSLPPRDADAKAQTRTSLTS